MPGKLARSDPRPSVRVTRGAGSGQHLASVLQEGRENANIDTVWDSSGESRLKGILIKRAPGGGVFKCGKSANGAARTARGVPKVPVAE